MKTHRTLTPVLVGLLLFGAACGGSADDSSTTEPPSSEAGMVDPEQTWTDDDVEAARNSARAVLGMKETAVPADVRVARRGTEEMMLTMDFVLGRRTVELDDDGSGYRVVAVSVELPEGSERFDLPPG
jgi:hypothetical protein